MATNTPTLEQLTGSIDALPNSLDNLDGLPWCNPTLEQLDAWGFIYDEIYFGKPNADLFVDDKAFHASKLQKLCSFIEKTEAFDSRYETKLCKIDTSLKLLEESE